jgi:hypothetical protein
VSGVRCEVSVRCQVSRRQVSDLSVTVKNVILQCTRVAIMYNFRYHGILPLVHMVCNP